jgi:hypothetical protein
VPAKAFGESFTDEQWAQLRSMVTTLAGYGVSHEDIAAAIGTEGIDAKTLRKYFRAELDKGIALGNVNVGRSIYEQAVGRGAQYDEKGQLIREELKPDKSAAIFLSKVRLGFKETQKVEVSGPNGGPIPMIDLDLSVLTDEEFDLFMALYRKAKKRSEDSEGGAAAAA